MLLSPYHLKSNMLKHSSALKKKKKAFTSAALFLLRWGFGHGTLTKAEGD